MYFRVLMKQRQHYLFLLLLLIILSTQYSYGQTQSLSLIKGHKYTNCNADYIYIADDTLLISTLNDGDSAYYWYSGDTLFTRQYSNAWQGNRSWTDTVITPYILSNISTDSFIIKTKAYYGKEYHPIPQFINNKYLEHDIKDFEYIGIHHQGPFWGESQLYIDNNRMAVFIFNTNRSVIHGRIDTALTPKNHVFSISEQDHKDLLYCIRKAQFQHKNCMTRSHPIDESNITIVLKTKDDWFMYNNSHTTQAQSELMMLYEKILNRVVKYKK